MRWFFKSWWDYLLAPHAEDVSLWTVFWCRASGHRAGVVWYTSTGEEPDMHCKKCYDNLA